MIKDKEVLALVYDYSGYYVIFFCSLDFPFLPTKKILF